MESIESFLSGLQRVTENCYAVFAPFYAERQRNYLYPMYYQSVTQMIAAGGFFYKIFTKQGRKTLAIFKRSSIMGNYSVMLHIAPISLVGCRQDELDIMQEARRCGLPLLVMGVRNYNSPLNDVNKIIHFLDCKIAVQGATQAVYANLGAAVGRSGLEFEKENLKPCAHQQIYRVAPINRLDIQKIKSLLA